MAHTAKKSHQEVLEALLLFNEFLMRFSSIKREIWVPNIEGRERNGEHSYQLAMVAWFLNQTLALNLDLFRLIRYALVHDLHEVHAGDSPAFTKGAKRTKSAKAKKLLSEELAKDRLRKEWTKHFPDLIEAMDSYHAGEDEESRFIYALEKLIAVINVYQDDGRAWKKLRLSLEVLDSYKSHRVKRHDSVKALYEEMLVLLKAKPHLFNDS